MMPQRGDAAMPSFDPSRSAQAGPSRHAEMDDSDHDEKPQTANQTRKAQNRIAQREFRLRKQIRDLEARVEVLSANKDERVELMTVLVRDLLKENKELRSMVKSMASFVGEGMGSCIPRMGISISQLDTMLNKVDPETAHEALLAVRDARSVQQGSASSSTVVGTPDREQQQHLQQQGAKRKRDSPEHGSSTGSSRPANGSQEGDSSSQTPEAISSYDHLLPNAQYMPLVPTQLNQVPTNHQTTLPSASAPPVSASVPIYSWAEDTGQSQRDLMLGQLEAQTNFVQPLSSTAYHPFILQDGFGHPFPTPSPIVFRMEPPGPPADNEPSHPSRLIMSRTDTCGSLKAAILRFVAASTQYVSPGTMTPRQVDERRKIQQEIQAALKGTGISDGDRKVDAATQLSFHLNNHRMRTDYALPPSLRPTQIQRDVPHEHAIDGMVFPSIRDRMILHRRHFDLSEVMYRYFVEFTIHTNDVCNHRSWEVSEQWLRDYPYLVDDEVYDIMNYWRRQRGDRILIKPNNGVAESGQPPGFVG